MSSASAPASPSRGWSATKDGAGTLYHSSSVQPDRCHNDRFGGAEEVDSSSGGVEEAHSSSTDLSSKNSAGVFDSDVDLSLFVGDLASNVTDTVLASAFAAVAPIREARVMRDHINRSKGFVSFFRREDAEVAVERMQGQVIGSRRVRIGWAEHKKEHVLTPVDTDTVERAGPANTNVYIGNLSPTTTDGDLRRIFSVYGAIKSVRLHARGGYGFVNYVTHEAARAAIVGLHASMLNGTLIRCSWGKMGPDTALPLSVQEMVLRQHQLQHLTSSALGAGGADLAATLAGLLSAPRAPRQQPLPPAMPVYMQHGAVLPEAARQHAAMMAATAWQQQQAVPQHLLYPAHAPHPVRGMPPRQGMGQQQPQQQQQSASELEMLTSRMGHLLLAQQQERQQQPYAAAHPAPRQGYPAPSAADAEGLSQAQPQLDPQVFQMLMMMYGQGT
ncbi:hypothetical protein FOA52_004004 [Chlamydomonas sp. UWO 241]|nr:hypothetical protein FOA52_004004 [Chlamydomonas sp. UWO 241]